MASNNEILINPQMPSSWDKASLENVKVGTNQISIYYSKTDERLNLRVVQLDDAGWKIEIHLPKGIDYETFDEVDVSDFQNKMQFETTLDTTEIIIHY